MNYLIVKEGRKHTCSTPRLLALGACCEARSQAASAAGEKSRNQPVWSRQPLCLPPVSSYHLRTHRLIAKLEAGLRLSEQHTRSDIMRMKPLGASRLTKSVRLAWERGEKIR